MSLDLDTDLFQSYNNYMATEKPQAPSDLAVVPAKDGIFEEVWAPLLQLKSLTIPVSAPGGTPPGFLHITDQTSGSGKLAPVYSDPGLAEGTAIPLPALSLLTGLFETPGFRGIIFNPPARYSNFTKTLERENWSLLIGYLESGTIPGDPLNRAIKEFNSGRPHAAYYCFSLLPDRPDYQPQKLLLARILVQLGLYAKAGETMRDYFQKNPKTAQALFLMAEISRKSGNLQQARSWAEQAAAAAPETGQESRVTMEPGWLELESANPSAAEKFFRQNLKNPSCGQEAAVGLAMSLKDIGLKSNDNSRLAEASALLKEAAVMDGPLKAQALFQLGIVLMRLSDLGGAENCYKQSLELRPSLMAKVNLGFTLLMQKKNSEALGLCREIYLFDRDSASAILSRIPAGTALPETPSLRDKPGPPETTPRPVSGAALEISKVPAPAVPPAVSPPAVQNTPPADTAVQAQKTVPQKPAADVPLPLRRPQQQQPPEKTQPDRPADAFLSRAYSLADGLDKNFGFTPEGLSAVENKLRLSFLKAGDKPFLIQELALNSAAFLCEYLSRRLKGKLLQFKDEEPWTWLMTFENSNFATFPAERCWQFLRSGELPEPGWLTGYARYVESEVKKAGAAGVSGVEAVKRGLKSSPHCITDVATDHRRVMLILSRLDETKNIKHDRAGIAQLEKALKSSIRPGQPSPDTWRLLRCYGHILAEILTVEFRAEWFNTDGGDGLWSVKLPWGVFTFPFGKIYKAALQGESLSDYYLKLEAGKPGPAGPAK